jgi:hypothetical protein
VKDDGIYRVMHAIGTRLDAALGAGSVFVGPLDDPAASGAKLVVFLYRVIPTPTLRNHEHRVPTGGVPPIEIYRNALALDLYFLLATGTIAGDGETLLRSLGKAMQALQAAPELSGSEVNQETVRLSVEPLTTEDASRIWALYPAVNYRTSVAYLASPVWIDPDVPETAGPLVVQDQLYAGAGAKPVGTAA